MIQKLKNLFKNKNEKNWLSAINFKVDIKALGIESYKNVNIFYLSKPSNKQADLDQPIYHFFYKKEFYFEEADTLSELKTLAKAKIDSLK